MKNYLVFLCILHAHQFIDKMQGEKTKRGYSWDCLWDSSVIFILVYMHFPIHLWSSIHSSHFVDSYLLMLIAILFLPRFLHLLWLHWQIYSMIDQAYQVPKIQRIQPALMNTANLFYLRKIRWECHQVLRIWNMQIVYLLCVVWLEKPRKGEM